MHRWAHGQPWAACVGVTASDRTRQRFTLRRKEDGRVWGRASRKYLMVRCEAGQAVHSLLAPPPGRKRESYAPCRPPV